MVSLQAAVLALAIAGGGETVLLDFRADWCAPCRQMDPVVDQLAARGYPVRKIDVDAHRELAARHRVKPIPCFVMLVDGREVAREVGVTSYARLEQLCRMAPEARQGPGAATARSSPRTRDGLAIPMVDLGTPRTLIAPPRQESAADPPRAGAAEAAPPEVRQEQEHEEPDAHFVAWSVRLRIEDADGHSCGSGTIIDARRGQALILTCGHIFRKSQGRGTIEVDLFGPTPATKIPGRLVVYDEQRDLGLVSIHAPGPVEVARVAPPGYRIAKGDPVVSVGCNHGADPTVRRSRIVSIDRYLGAPNLQIDDQPVEGRSGGGLFTPDGLVIGVCYAADPADREGLFAALGAIHAQLDESRLAFVYQDLPAMPSRMPRSSGEPHGGTPPREPLAPGADVRSAEDLAGTLPRGGSAVAPPHEGGAGLTPEEQATLEEIRRRQARGAEVILIVRPTGDPRAKSEIFRLRGASPALLNELASETPRSESDIRETSLAVPGLVAGRGSRLPPPIPMADRPETRRRY